MTHEITQLRPPSRVSMYQAIYDDLAKGSVKVVCDSNHQRRVVQSHIRTHLKQQGIRIKTQSEGLNLYLWKAQA